MSEWSTQAVLQQFLNYMIFCSRFFWGGGYTRDLFCMCPCVQKRHYVLKANLFTDLKALAEKTTCLACTLPRKEDLKLRQTVGQVTENMFNFSCNRESTSPRGSIVDP